MSTNFEPNEYFIFGQSTKIGTHENKAIHSMLHLANTEFCCQYHNDVCHINYNDISRRHHQYYEKRMGVNIVHCFYVDDFIHFASRKKYQSPRCRRDPESQPSVQDLQHEQLDKPRHGLQILDTGMGFPRPFCKVVIEYS